jgi:VWFA-related protein
MRLRAIILASFAMATGVGGLAGPNAGWTQETENAAMADVPSSPDPSVPTLKVYSRETIVDVSVTDSEGRPVHGLKKSDFTVAENGKPQPIHSLTESDQLLPESEAEEPVGFEPGIYTNAQPVPENGPVNILLLDAFGADPADVVHEQSATMDYIKTMPPGTQLAVFWLSSSGLHMLQGFTSQPELLHKAVETRMFDFSANLEKWTRDWYTVDALKQIAAYVSRIKGRKNLLWVTHGMPIPLLPDGGYGWGDPEASNGWLPPDMGVVNRLMDTYELLTDEQVAVYPIDPGGVRGLGMGTLRAEAVAEGLGGVAFYNSNDLSSAMASAIDNGSHFYTLSYFPPKQKDDGHYHTIKIEVDRPGLRLVYRKDYNAEEPRLPAPQSGPSLMKAALQAKVPPATQLLFDVQVLPGTQPGKPGDSPPTSSSARKHGKASLTRFDLQYTVELSQIALANNPDGTRGDSLEFDAAAYNNKRKLVTNIRQTMQLPLPGDDAQQFEDAPFQFLQHLDLPPGQVYLRVGVLDRTSNKVGTLEIPLTVPNNPTHP